MNMQAMMRQAQKLQNDMMKEKEKIDSQTFEGTSSIVKVKVNGKKELLEVKISDSDINSEDIEMLEDMIVIAVNDALTKVDKEIEEKMGRYTKGMPGLF